MPRLLFSLSVLLCSLHVSFVARADNGPMIPAKNHSLCGEFEYTPTKDPRYSATASIYYHGKSVTFGIDAAAEQIFAQLDTPWHEGTGIMQGGWKEPTCACVTYQTSACDLKHYDSCLTVNTIVGLPRACNFKPRAGHNGFFYMH